MEPYHCNVSSNLLRYLGRDNF